MPKDELPEVAEAAAGRAGESCDATVEDTPEEIEALLRSIC